MDQPAFVTAQEAAEQLGVGIRMIRRLCEERRIRYYKIGRHVRFRPSDLEAFLTESVIDPTSSNHHHGSDRGRGLRSRTS